MKKEKPTITLSMIVKDEVEQVTKIIKEAIPYFDKIEIVVSDEKAFDKFGDVDDVANPKVTFWHRPWNNRFDEARNYAQEKVKTDYWFWLDADDEFDFKAIPALVEIMENGQYDQIMLPYNYAQDDEGNCIAFHWRERLMRTSHPFTWKGWVHETPISDLPYRAHRVQAPVNHTNGEDHTEESLQRNHKILLEATKATDDPRYQLYLGTSFYSLREYGQAVEILDQFIKVSGNGEDIYRALCCMSECAVKMKRLNAAIQYALQAAAQIPEYPQAYRLMAQWESERGAWHESIEWCKMAASKSEPTGMGVFDPTANEQVYLIAARAEFMLKNFNKALKWLRRLPEDHSARGEFEEDFIKEADAETFITMLPKFRQYFEDEDKLYNALCYDLRYDSRLTGLRDIVVKPKTWSDKSIVILCGEGYEDWGPQTLDKGMGGSEEAVVYLSRELAKLGWEVTVFGAVENITHDLLNKDGSPYKIIVGPIQNSVDHPDYQCPPEELLEVKYVPWREINKSDNFNVFVAWRAPDFTKYIKAKAKIADIHDVLNKSDMKNYADVTYFVKSNFHRELYPDLPDNKFKVIGNGIEKGQF